MAWTVAAAQRLPVNAALGGVITPDWIMNRFIDISDQISVALPDNTGLRPAYLFTAQDAMAINAAIAAQRPLLIRAESSHPKREFAVAAAHLMNRGFIEVDVDDLESFTELLWQFDGEMRRAKANLVSMMGSAEDELRDRLDTSRFIRPGPVWWTLDPLSARHQAESSGAQLPYLPDGADWEFVLFINDIDFCDDRYLRRLGRLLRRGYFDGPNGHRVAKSVDPLIVLATSEERSLPEPFLRDCLVLSLAFPDAEGLVAWARSSYPEVSEQVIRIATDLIVRDRQYSIGRAVTPPGLQDFLDLLRSVAVEKLDEREQIERLQMVERFTSKTPSPSYFEEEPEEPAAAREADVFVSYASGVEDEFVERLYRFLRDQGLNARIDKVDVAYKESLGNYIDSLGRGAAIIAVISDKYLRSPWCMWELLKIHEAKMFRERIFPIVLSDATITDGIGRLNYAEFWESRLSDLDAAMRRVGPMSIAPATVEEGRRIRDFADKVDLLTSMVADMSFRAMDDLSDEALESLSQSLLLRLRELKVGDN